MAQYKYGTTHTLGGLQWSIDTTAKNPKLYYYAGVDGGDWQKTVLCYTEIEELLSGKFKKVRRS